MIRLFNFNIHIEIQRKKQQQQNDQLSGLYNGKSLVRTW